MINNIIKHQFQSKYTIANKALLKIKEECEKTPMCDTELSEQILNILNEAEERICQIETGKLRRLN